MKGQTLKKGMSFEERKKRKEERLSGAPAHDPYVLYLSTTNIFSAGGVSLLKSVSLLPHPFLATAKPEAFLPDDLLSVRSTVDSARPNSQI